MGTSRGRASALVAAAATAAVLLTGCGGSSTSGGTYGLATTPAGSSPASPSAVGTKVTSTETEFSIALSTQAFTAGTYTFDVQNTGTMAHNLTIEGPGVAQTSPTAQPGGSSQITVNLQKGTYELSCSIDGHKAQGMDLKIQVT